MKYKFCNRQPWLALGCAVLSLSVMPLHAQEAEDQLPIFLAADDSSDTTQRQVRVGSASEPDRQPAPAAALFEAPGILTPQGVVQLEPSVQYSYSSSNRVTLVGYTVIPALLIGSVDVREVKRNTLTGALSGRYGLTNRVELEYRLPYAFRNDSTISRPLGASSSDSATIASGQSIGDVELGARFQLNDGTGGWPFLVGGLRWKSRTGKDTFDTPIDASGQPQELATGSGFNSLQPSLTWLIPSDPAVFFGGLSYTYNFKRSDVSQLGVNGGRTLIGDIEPGGVLGINFGMGLALNEKSSFSIGFDLNSIDRTRVNGEYANGSVRTQLASLLMGYSYRVSPKTTLSLTVSAGLTRDTPDLTVNFKIPMSF